MLVKTRRQSITMFTPHIHKELVSLLTPAEQKMTAVA